EQARPRDPTRPTWIERLRAPRVDVTAPDAPERGELYTQVVWPYWSLLKEDIRAAVDEFNLNPVSGARPVQVEDADRKLLLRGGDGQGLDLTLNVEREHVLARYVARLSPGRPSRSLKLRLDMRPEHLVMLDCRGCVIDEPVQFLLERFFRSLAPKARPSRRRW
ncbi:MAG: hypothetical protein ACRDFW_09000, partial [bacterium]